MQLRAQLNTSIGRPLSSTYHVDATASLPKLPDDADIMAIGLYNNSSIALAKASITIADYDKKLLVASLYPDIFYNYQANRDITPMKTLGFSWSINPTFQRSRVRSADYAIEREELNYNAVVRTVKSELHQAVTEYNLYKRLIIQAEAAKTLAKTQLERQTLLFKTGQVSQLDLKETELAFITTKTTALDITMTYNKTVARLLQLMGVLL